MQSDASGMGRIGLLRTSSIDGCGGWSGKPFGGRVEFLCCSLYGSSSSSSSSVSVSVSAVVVFSPMVS
jgi:hypothetical protein